MQVIRRLLQLFGLRSKPENVIIVGVEYPEYQLGRELEREGRHQVLFYINEDPWKNRTTIGEAELRYPAELEALCRNHAIDKVYYINEALLETLPAVTVPVVKWTNGEG